MTRDEQLALLDVFIHEATRRHVHLARRGVVPHLVDVLRETGHLLVLTSPDFTETTIDLTTHEAIGGDEVPAS